MKINFIMNLSCIAASGPVRLFTPYKRRRRNQVNPDSSVHMKMKKHSEEDSENDQSIVTKEETAWQTITDGIDGSEDYMDSSSQRNYLSQLLNWNEY